MPAPHLSWLISLPHALKIVKKLGQKRHRDAGYSFELTEIDDQQKVWRRAEQGFYATYSYGTTIYKLNIYYEKPDEAPQPNKTRVPRRGPRK